MSSALWTPVANAVVLATALIAAGWYVRSCVNDDSKNRLADIDETVRENAVALTRRGRAPSAAQLLGREAQLSTREAWATLGALRRQSEKPQ